MKRSRTLQGLALLIGGAAVALVASRYGEIRPVEAQEIKKSDAYKVTPERMSIARADLLVCDAGNGNLPIQHGRNVDLAAFAKVLNGTWVRRLTWAGLPLETESAFYFDLGAKGGQVMMIDQANLGEGPLTRKALALANQPNGLIKTPTLTFVDCELKYVDRYIKIADGPVFEGMPVSSVSSRPSLAKGAPRPLESAWSELVGKAFFDRFQSAVRLDLAARKVGGEMYLPARVGALWQADLKAEPVAGLYGARLHMKGQYRGTLEGMPIGKTLPGIETAQFFMEGGNYVAARIPDQNLTGWEAEACPEFLGLTGDLDWERVVLDPGQQL